MARWLLLWALLVAGAASFCFLWSGRLPLFDTDEPRYAQAAREMMERSDWVLPTFNGEPRYAKPVLFYWLLIGAYRLFGIHEFAARFWSGIAALLIAASLFLSLRFAFNFEAAAFATLCWLTALGTQLFAHAAITDMVLTAFMTGAILAAWHGWRSGQRIWFFVATIATAGAVLTKGPVGLVLPLAILATTGIATKSWQRKIHWQWRDGWIALGCLMLFLALVLPWYWAINVRTRGAFLQQFLLVENVQRYAQSGKIPLWLHLVYFPLTAFLLAFPWSSLAIAAFTPLERLTDNQRAWHTLFRCWALVPVVLFTFSQTKNPQYVLLSTPALSALAALWVTSAASDQERGGKSLWAIAMAMAAVLLFAAHFAINAVPDWRLRLTGGEPIHLGIGFLAMSTLAAIGIALYRLPRRWLVLSGSALLLAFHFFAFHDIASQIGRYRQEPLKRFAQLASFQLAPTDQLVVYRRDLSSVVFYSNRRVMRVDDLTKLEQLLKQPRRVDVLTHVRWLPEVMRIRGVRLVERHGAFVWVSNRPATQPKHLPNSTVSSKRQPD